MRAEDRPPLPELRLEMQPQPSDVTEFTEAEDATEDALASGLTVTFQDLSYTVASNAKWRETVTLLSGISGSFYAGQMLALMGPSGSGKTTLLDLLAGRKTTGVMSGTILYSGHAPTKSFLRRHTGYVEQCDTLLANLTVFEMLAYTAELKNPVSEPLKAKAAKVEQVLQQLGLSGCRGVRIGSQLARGISGGQCKRVNIGIALVTHPRVLFLDEPTSGLDSFTAAEVITAVASLAAGGITVCATIHSPSAAVFRQFDRLMMLLSGRLVYSGACVLQAQSSKRHISHESFRQYHFAQHRVMQKQGQLAVDYFLATMPDIAPSGAADSTNPAEWLAHLTAQADREGATDVLAAAYQGSALRASNDERLQDDAAAPAGLPPAMVAELSAASGTATPFAHGVWVLLKYRGRRDLTDFPGYLAPRVLDKLAIALLIMTLYWRVGVAAEGVAAIARSINLSAALFMWTILPGFAAAAYCPTLVEERPLINRELADGLYAPGTYLTAKLLEEGAVALVQTLALSVLTYFPLRLGGQWLLYWFVYFQTTCIGIVLAYLVAALSPNIYVANAALPAYAVTLLFFIGLLMRPADQPGYWHWYSYIDFLRYGWVAQMLNQFEHSRVLIAFGVELLDFYSLRGLNKWRYAWYEFAFLVGMLFLAWAALSLLRHTKR